MSLRRKKYKWMCVCLLLIGGLIRPSSAQTYKLGDNPPPPPQDSETQKKKDSQQKDAQKSAPQKPLGWGSNIENARLGRAAEQALKKGDYKVALDYAERATRSAPNDPKQWFLLGYVARLARKTQLSLDSYNHGLRLDPSSLDGLSGLAQTYNTMGRREEAERLLNQVLAANPKRHNDAALLGEIYLQTGRYDDALRMLGGVESAQPAARTELLIALTYERMKQFEQANRYLTLAKTHAPNNPEVKRAVASYYRETGNYAAAIATLKSIHNPSPQVKAELAYTYQLSGNADEAAKLFMQAANAAPGDLNLQLSAAQAAVAANHIEKADPFLKRAAGLNPDHYRLHAIRGQIARLQDQNQDAVREYNAALASLPANPPEGNLYGIQLHVNLVELYRTLQDENSAQQHLQTAQAAIGQLNETGAKRPEFLRLRATIEMFAGDLKKAGDDIQEALNLDPNNPNNMQLSGDLLVKMGRPQDALAIYQKILAIDAKNRSALTAAGFVSRTVGDNKQAEKYFDRLAADYPRLYQPHLALGDLYASQKEFDKAEASYRKAYDRSNSNSLIIAGGMNAAIEAKRLPLAEEWMSRATPQMLQHPFVMREQERYYSLKGDYEKSAEIGREAIKKLPNDRDVVVYLGYDLLHLEKYDELSELTAQYKDKLPKEPDIPLLAGYVHKHNGQLEEARQDFSLAAERDPKVTTAIVNRGYVLKELHQPTLAAADFEAALRADPKNGEAHLGLAYTDLDLHRPHAALKQVQLAQQVMGDSLPIHLIRAAAYAGEGSLTKAAAEYRVAIQMSPETAGLHMALADVLYGLNQYTASIEELRTSEKLDSSNPEVYAKLARSYAQLRDRENTLQNVHLAESRMPTDPKEKSNLLLETGEALGALGDRQAAMQRFEQALDIPGADRFGIRLAIGKQMAIDNKWDDARRQVALGMMEVKMGQTAPAEGHEWIEAADIFLRMNEFQLAETAYQHALSDGASEQDARVGLANTYLAIGDTERAQAQIAAVGREDDSEPSYQFLLAKANLYRHQHQNTQALTAFAQAADAAGENASADREMLIAAGNEGMRINQHLSVLSNFTVSPIFEDTTVYPLDAKLDVLHPLPGQQNLLPLPRSSMQTEFTGAYHLHFGGFPDAGGFFQVRNSRGEISLPSADRIVDRDTTDYSFNIGLNPILHLGRNVLSFNTGIQETIRRDSSDPVDMNQNLFRQFVYMSSSSFFNMVSVRGYAIRESGPFTEKNQSSRDLSASVEFRVGRPWNKTALIVGWGARDEIFNPIPREFYYTSTYGGIEHRFSERLTLRAVMEDLRSWRVEGTDFAIAQAIRPAGTILYAPNDRWRFEGNFAYSRNSSFHAYDAVQSGFTVSYAMPFHRSYRDENGQVQLSYPVRFTGGIQQQSFFEFPGANSQQFRPFIGLTIF